MTLAMAIKAGLAVLLVLISATMMFVTVVPGAEDVKAMILILTGIAVRDFYSDVQHDKRVEQIKQAYDPTPPAPHSFGEDGK